MPIGLQIRAAPARRRPPEGATTGEPQRKNPRLTGVENFTAG